MIAPPATLIPQPEGYADWLAALKARVHSAQQRATLAVNRHGNHAWRLFSFLGGVIPAQAGIQAFPSLSPCKLWFPAFAGMTTVSSKDYVSQARLPWVNRELIVQEVLARLPWYHHLTLLEKLPSIERIERA